MRNLGQIKVILFSIAILFVIGIVLVPIKKMANFSSPYPEQQNSPSENFILGILGGYRPIIADFMWIKAYTAWEKKDVANCISNIEFASKLDPSSRMFWHMGSNMIAYDTPHWICSRDKVGKTIQRHIFRRQGKLALDFLDRGLEALPKSRQLLIDKALIYEKNFNDMDSALTCYAKANDENAPMYIVRNHSSALESLGRYAEALDILKKALPRFDKSHPATKVYEEHIALVEDKLKSQKN